MSYIDFEDYKTIINYYSDAKLLLENSITYFEDAVNLIVALDDLQPELDLLQPFYDAYLMASDTFSGKSVFTGAVRALQSHTLVRSGESTVNDWLDEQDAVYQVPCRWADLSALAGYVYEDSKTDC